MYYSYHTYADHLSRGGEDQILNLLFSGIQRKAAAVDFYGRMAGFAPNEEHRSHLVRIAEDEREQWQQLTGLYTSMTGAEPVYTIQQVPFHSYHEGLQRGYESELESYEQYRLGTLLTNNPAIYETLLNACMGDWEHADRLNYLKASNENNRMDYGPEPFAVDIDDATEQNNNFRTALWTGEHLQVTLMSIGVGEDIGLENHPNLDQFLRIEQGRGVVQMGDDPNNLNFQRNVEEDFAIVIPAGKWHNLTNTGNEPLKLYSIYAPPQHPKGTVHKTKADAMAAEAAEHGRKYFGEFWG
jgi:mannose-6-phosphate isomerase-like protein (cupin superfamily)